MRKMKDSGIEWIGKIPNDWSIQRFKYVVNSLNKGNGITKDEVFPNGDVECVRYGEIYSKYNHSFQDCFSRTNKDVVSSPQYFSYGDILFAGTGELIEEIGKSIVYLGSNACLAGGDIIVAKHSQNPSFLNYAMSSYYAQYQKSLGKAKLKVVHITASQIGNIRIILPPLPEQKKIADFLDAKCADIDQIRADIEKQIEILTDYKKSIITEAVTKGLDPKAKMKDSGIVRIGQIPKPWKTSRIKYLFSVIGSGTTPQSGNQMYYDGDRCWIQSGDLYKTKYIVDTEKKITEYAEKTISALKRYSADFLIVAMYGASIGNVSISKIDACVNQACCVIKPNDKVDFNYLYYSLINGKDIMLDMSIGGTQPNISLAKLLEFPVLLPPLSEQQAIASFLDEKCSEIDATIAEKQKQLETLEEYKKSLIFEYVTGKKEVV